MTDARNEDWYETFWGEVGDFDDDDGATALRLIGEMFADGVIGRYGDDLQDGPTAAMSTWLAPAEQYLIRRIEDASKAASRP